MTSMTRAETPSGPRPSMIRAVAGLPQEGAEALRRPHEQDVVELVEIPLVEQELVERRGCAWRGRTAPAGCGCRTARRRRSRAAMATNGASITQSGTSWMSCRLWCHGSEARRQNSAWASPMKRCVKDTPANSAPSARRHERHAHGPAAAHARACNLVAGSRGLPWKVRKISRQE